MFAYILRRLLGMIPTLLVVSILVFIIIQLPPGDFMTSLQAEIAATGGGQDSRTLDALRQRYGLDQPMYIQYLKWMAGFPRGDFGYSLEWNAPVWDLIAGRLAFTILLGGLALILMWVIAVPIGIYSATHQYSLGDNLFTFLGFVGLSFPDFLLALVYMVVASLVFGMSSSGLFSQTLENAPWSLAKVLDLLNHLWAPVLILGAAGTAELIRIMRGNMLDVLGQQYITTARAKGLKERIVINKYAVRVAINPLVSVLGMQIPKMISGSIIIGVVLSIPSIGPMFLRALTTQDMYLAGSLLLFMTVLLLIGNLLADIALAWIDPRIRYE
ncbi:binding-protein-dependent transport systems inner membrane component [Candidatus Moduliflexus flocculans]|uniref:Binding-protein-dependent transport systems inner membrane component n=1 Tax=Candidatus Moduliflexus flocculans TaxID=1499966 RepID=A0A081BMM2_9BACT|nr:binding-protein-dependent transport systems inner membrane component [Candidatus Moduliflexus flocculans]